MLLEQLQHSLLVNLTICGSNVFGMNTSSDEYRIHPSITGTCNVACQLLLVLQLGCTIIFCFRLKSPQHMLGKYTYPDGTLVILLVTGSMLEQ